MHREGNSDFVISNQGWKSVTPGSGVLCTFPNFYLPQNVFVAVGRGLYVYNLPMKRVIACQKAAHDSSVLHVARLPNRYELPSAW